MKTSRRFYVLPLLLCAGLLACSPEEPTTESPVAVQPAAKPKAPLEPLPALRTGSRALSTGNELTATLSASFNDQSNQYLELKLPLGSSGSNLYRQHIELTGGAPGDFAVQETSSDSGQAIVLLRRQLDATGTPVGALFAQSWESGALQWQRLPFKVGQESKAGNDPNLKNRWISAFAAQFGDTGIGTANPWLRFASGRVQALLPGGLKAVGSPTAGQERPTRRTELAQLMDTTSGMLSMQEALQYDRGLRLDRAPVPRTIPVASLSLPALDAHPFAAMQAKLAKPDGGTPEPLAAAVPAEFWYARVDDIRLLLRLLDEADAWITPVVQILQSNPEDRQLATRYQAQLGLRRSGLAKLFGHTVVGQVAITGSDPYLREGSDVTLIFSIKQQAIFDSELAGHLDAYRSSQPDLATTTREHGGISISVSQDSTGTVRQQRAQVGDLAIVSNSARACDRVIDAIQGNTARLADEADLKYMLARDPGTHQALAFLSDKFIGAVIGPQQKILAARRQQALAELLTPGYAALLHGWWSGAAPASTEALISSGLLASDELKHSDGAVISFEPGASARSSWGTPAALTPMIDLPAVTEVSEAEKVAYEQFVGGYQQYWKQFIDPVAIRLDLKEDGGAATAEIDVRILPLISGTDYSEIEAVVGTTRLEVPAIERGLQAVWAVGAEARLRTELDGMLRSASGQNDIGLGWLGNWVALGLDDRATLVELLSKFDDTVQLPVPKVEGGEFNDLDLWRRVGKFPIYAAAEVKNPLMLVATLTAIRGMLGQVAPGMVEWGEAGKYRELPIVRIGASKTAPLPNRDMADAVALHYVQTGSAFVLALNVETLHHVIDQLLDGQSPKTVTEPKAQFVFDARSERGRPLWTALLWLIQGQAYDAQSSARRSAEILLRGDPATQTDPSLLTRRGMDYFGFVPVTAMGDSAFSLQPEGAGDALTGTNLVPKFVDLPIPGSPVETLMNHLSGLRGEISFDKEPDSAGANARSLHTRLQVGLGAE